MLGAINKFDTETNEGKILGEDKELYDFHIGEWLSNQNIILGQKVYYQVEEDEARNIELDEERVLYFEIHFKRGGGKGIKTKNKEVKLEDRFF
jgi:hypothetical protein